MVMFVHLTPARNAAAIRRSGIRPGHTVHVPQRTLADTVVDDEVAPAGSVVWHALRGIFAFPVTVNHLVTHQWHRELRRWGQRNFCTVSFRIPDDQNVWIGTYGQLHEEVTAAEAAGMVFEAVAADPDTALGLEIFLPSGVTPRQIHRIEPARRPVGWRFYPGAHGRTPCVCPICLKRGEYGARKLRERLRHR